VCVCFFFLFFPGWVVTFPQMAIFLFSFQNEGNLVWDFILFFGFFSCKNFDRKLNYQF
jgi:hypothetical protein